MIFEDVFISPEVLFTKPGVLGAAYGLAGSVFVRTYDASNAPPSLWDMCEPKFISSSRAYPTKKSGVSNVCIPGPRFEFERETTVVFHLPVRFESEIPLGCEFEFTANVYHWPDWVGVSRGLPWLRLLASRLREEPFEDWMEIVPAAETYLYGGI